tara:strand:+ start:52 stop:666 length:615 start_codon:yes stop_codon:yes gene_type:complete
MTISRAQMGTQLKGNRAMKKMKKYANGNMIDPNTPGVANSLRPKLRPNTSQGLADPMSTKGPSPVLTPAMKRKRLEEKRKRVSESPGMNKRLNASRATGAKGSQMGSELTADKMATDPARGGVDPANERADERAKSMLSGMADMKKGGKVKKMMGGGGVSGLYGKGAMEKELEAKKMMGGGMKEGGKVRGAGMAKKGVRACKMR